MSSVAYYNEIDPFAADWLRHLIAAGHIAPGDVDTRSIEDVPPDDLREYTQCHFFAGIGVWSYALRRAGWSDDRAVWTGSCPCQPYSPAGKGAGVADERHLWPAWHHLIEERRPPVIFGEQVSAAIRHGWADIVRADLEAAEYAVGFSVFGAHSVGAPHIRQRLWFVANRMANAAHQQHDGSGNVGPRGRHEYSDRGAASGLADTNANRRIAVSRQELHDVEHHAQSRSATYGAWDDVDWLLCRDGKWRPVEPGTFPLAHGAPGRVGRLRAYGNAINAEAAEVFIRAYDETCERVA